MRGGRMRGGRMRGRRMRGGRMRRGRMRGGGRKEGGWAGGEEGVIAVVGVGVEGSDSSLLHTIHVITSYFSSVWNFSNRCVFIQILRLR